MRIKYKQLKKLLYDSDKLLYLFWGAEELLDYFSGQVEQTSDTLTLWLVGNDLHIMGEHSTGRRKIMVTVSDIARLAGQLGRGKKLDQKHIEAEDLWAVLEWVHDDEN